MHFFAPDKNFWGGHGIVGGQTPLGLGLAYGIKYKGLKGAALCFLGDGAVNQGCFYECLNMAALFDLPVIYIIENNEYSMGTSLDRSSAVDKCLAQRAEAFGIDWVQANGEDLYEVRADHAAGHRTRSQRVPNPTVIEFDTYRYYGHSVADAKHKGGYRKEEEIEKYKNEHDPIQLFKRRLMAEKVLTEEQYEAIDDRDRRQKRPPRRALQRRVRRPPRRVFSRTFISKSIARPKPVAREAFLQRLSMASPGSPLHRAIFTF